MDLRKQLILYSLTHSLTHSLTGQSKPIGYFQSFQHYEISPASGICDTNKGKIPKIQTFYLSTPSKWRGGVKNENSSPLDQTQANFVYIFCGPPEGQKYKNQPPKGGGVKNKNSSSLDQRASSQLTKSREISTKTFYE